jgi:tetratricopeptide (TPR) repeat protein
MKAKRIIRPVMGFLCGALLATGPAWAQDFYAQGMTAFDAHQFASAASLFAKAETAIPGSSDALFLEGKSLAKVERFSEAELALQRYSARHPDSADALYMLGFVLNRVNKPRQSLEVYNRAAKLTVPRSDDLKTVALDYVLLNDYPDAIRWMKQAVAFDPKNEQAWYGLGRCYYTQSSFADAQTAFERALALDPKDAKAAINLALTLEMRNQPANADRAYKQAIALADEDPRTDQWPYLDYGSFLLDQGRAAEAVAPLRKAAALAPNCADCHGKLGRALEATGKFADGVKELERAVALAPKDPKLHYALGRAYRSAGMAEKSRQEMALSAKLYGTKDATGHK